MSSFASSDDTDGQEYRSRRRHRSSRDTSSAGSRYPFPAPRADETADSIYMAEMVRYRELWQQNTEKLKETERRHWEEMQMKEKAFTNMVDVLQKKFDDCKNGLTRLGQERDEYQRKCHELTAKLGATSQSYQKESDANMRNSARTQELENQLAQLGELHEETKMRCEDIQEQLQNAAAELAAKNELITKHKITIETQSRDIQQLSDIVGKHVEKDKRRKKKEIKEAEIIGKQSEELERLTELVESQSEKITQQKQQTASLTERLTELDGEESRHQVVIEAQKKDIAYLTGYQSKQDEIIRMQREQIQKMHKRLNELKSKDTLAAEMKDQLLSREEDLRQTLNSKKMIEKKLDMLHDKLKSKEYLTYVPLCQNCKQLRTRMQKMKTLYIKNTRAMKKRIDKLSKKLASGEALRQMGPPPAPTRSHVTCSNLDCNCREGHVVHSATPFAHVGHSSTSLHEPPYRSGDSGSVGTIEMSGGAGAAQRPPRQLTKSKSARGVAGHPNPQHTMSSNSSETILESVHTQDSDGDGSDDEWDIDFDIGLKDL